MSDDGSTPETDAEPIGPVPPLTTSEALAPTAPATEATSRRGAFSGGIWSAASAVLPMAGTLALSIVIGRRLGTDVLGEQSLVAYAASSITHILVFSVTIASVQLLASASGGHDLKKAAWLARWSYHVHLATGLLSASILLLAGLERQDYRLLWVLAACTTLVDAVGWAHACRNIAQQGWGPTSSRRLVAQAVNPLLAIVAIYAGLGIDAVFAVQLVVSIVLTVALRAIDVRTNQFPPRERPAPEWRPVARLWGMFVVSGLIVQIVERRLELVFLDWYSDARSVAMYSVAFSLISIPTTLLGSLIGAAMPAIAARNAREPQAVELALGRAARVLLTLELVVVAGAVTVGPGVLLLAYGRDFVESARLVRWLGFSLLLTPLAQLYSTFWSGTGRLRPVLIAGGSAAVIDIALAWTLIPGLGTTGAVIATISAQLVSAGVLVVYSLRSGVVVDLRWWRLVRAGLVALAAGGAAVLLQHLVAGPLGLVLSVVAFMAVLGLGSRLVGMLDHSDVEWVAGTVPGHASRLVLALSRRG